MRCSPVFALDGLGRDLEIVVFALGIGELANGVDVLPGAGVECVLGVSDGRCRILCVEGYVNGRWAGRLCAFCQRLFSMQIADDRRCGVDFEALAFLGAGESFSGVVGGRIGRNDFDSVSAVGNKRGVEAVGFVGDSVFQQMPIMFTVAAEVKRVDKVVAVVVMSRPANCDGGAVLDGRERGVGTACVNGNDHWLA